MGFHVDSTAELRQVTIGYPDFGVYRTLTQKALDQQVVLPPEDTNDMHGPNLGRPWHGQSITEPDVAPNPSDTKNRSPGLAGVFQIEASRL